MTANRDRVGVQGLLNNASPNLGQAVPDFGIRNDGDTMFLFNENHVLRRLGLAWIESEDELRALIKPSHREFLYQCYNVMLDKRTSQSDISNGPRSLSDDASPSSGNQQEANVGQRAETKSLNIFDSETHRSRAACQQKNSGNKLGNQSNIAACASLNS